VYSRWQVAIRVQWRDHALLHIRSVHTLYRALRFRSTVLFRPELVADSETSRRGVGDPQGIESAGSLRSRLRAVTVRVLRVPALLTPPVSTLIPYSPS